MKSSRRPVGPPALAGRIVAAYGRRYLVDVGTEVLSCVTRGRRRDLACGDHVEVARTGPGDGVIDTVGERRSLFFRSDAHRQKLIAANVTQIVIVVAALPALLPELLDRCLAAAEHAEARALIVLNKCDLAQEAAAALAALQPYRALGYPVIALSARDDVSPLRKELAGQLSVLVGQSGVGKSTMINQLVENAAARTASAENDADSGRHTTTHARLYALDAMSAIVDSPGLQVFGVHQISPADLPGTFVEIRALAGQCRFSNCRHLSEPDCAVTAAVSAGTISSERIRSYRSLREELERK
jgi:ribosome biogenesis GTPase